MILAFLATAVSACAQTQRFDLTTFTPPKAWKKQATENGVQFTREDAAKGTYCAITLFKAVPATGDAKENYGLAWTSMVKEMVPVSGEPEMLAPATEDGWEVISGHSTFKQEGSKGTVLLVTASGFGKMVNIIILTNTDAYEKNVTSFLESVTLKKPVADTEQEMAGTNGNTTTTVASPAKTDGFTFSTTNFDDGWTSTVQEDWVLTTKGTTRVLIHYPNKKADGFTTDLLQGLKTAWDILVAPKYSSMSTVEFKPVSGWEPIELAEADAVDNATGTHVHIVLFKKNYSGGGGKYLEFVTRDRNSFVQEFGACDGTSGWEKVEKMGNYNKFAVAAADLKGKWTSNFSGAIQYVNAFTGYDAGMNTHASNENYHLGPGNAYTWDLGVASGAVGNIKFQSVKSAGRFSMIGNWKIHLSDIEGKPRTYDVSFTCIKGLRILWIDGKAFAKAE